MNSAPSPSVGLFGGFCVGSTAFWHCNHARRVLAPSTPVRSCYMSTYRRPATKAASSKEGRATKVIAYTAATQEQSRYRNRAWVVEAMFKRPVQRATNETRPTSWHKHPWTPHRAGTDPSCRP